MPDDGSKTSLGKGILGFMNNTNTTVGIIPNLGMPQQLLFLLKVPRNAINLVATNNIFKMEVLYNNQVIGF